MNRNVEQALDEADAYAEATTERILHFHPLSLMPLISFHYLVLFNHFSLLLNSLITFNWFVKYMAGI